LHLRAEDTLVYQRELRVLGKKIFEFEFELLHSTVTNRNWGHLSRWLFDNHTSYEGAMNMKMSYINDVPSIIILVNQVLKA
jgi:hypothetical protein